jgi:nitric oxide synthase oxygenase domain/subunit
MTDRGPVKPRIQVFGPYQPLELPAQLIRPSGGSATWMVDAAAAKLLDASTRGAS